MSRKNVKLILLIAGIAILAAGLSVFLVNIIGMASQEPSVFVNSIFAFIIFALIGFVPLGIASLMYSKDLRESKRVLSDLLKALACFCITGSALLTAALILICIFFM
jgi:hypothetical protein